MSDLQHFKAKALHALRLIESDCQVPVFLTASDATVEKQEIHWMPGLQLQIEEAFLATFPLLL